MRSLLYSIFIFSFSFSLIAQNNNGFYIIDELDTSQLYQSDIDLLDSCLTKYHQSESDSARISALGVICENMQDSRWIEYQSIQLDEIKTALSLKDDYFFHYSWANALNNKGFYYDLQGEMDHAHYYYNSGLDKFTELGDDKGRAISCNNIGYAFLVQGNVPKALEFFHKSLKISETLNDHEGVAYSSNNIGTIYDNQGNFKKALEYYQIGFEMDSIAENLGGQATSLSNIGYIYANKKESKLALGYFQRALDIRKGINDFGGMANSMNNIGAIYKNNQEYEIAKDYYEKSLFYNEKQGYKSGFVTSYNNLGNLALETGDLLKAKGYADKSVDIAMQLGSPDKLSEAAFLNARVSDSIGDWKQAFKMHVLYVTMRDSSFNQKNKELIVQFKYQVEYEKKSAADSVLRFEEIKLKNVEIAKQKVVTESEKEKNLYLYFLAGLLAVFAFLMFNRFRHTKKQNTVINEQKQAVESKNIQIQNQHLLLEETHREISDSIKYAEHLQKAILPDYNDLKNSFADGFVLYLPKDVVSGDFYWMFKTKNKILLAVADCTGHGVPGAMVSVVCSNALNRSVKEFGLIAPKDILNKTRELVIETFARSGKDVKDGMDIALCAKNENELIFAGANNPLWIVRNTEYITEEQKEERTTILGDKASLLEYKANSQPIGLYEGMKDFDQVIVPTFEGDTYYIFTDGFADQFGGNRGKKFKYKPFKQYLIDINDRDMNAQRDLINQKFQGWKGDIEQVDDVCIIGVKF